MKNSKNIRTQMSASALPEVWISNRPNRPEMVVAPNDVAVTYSRYSTDKQSDLSVERQEEKCEAYALRTGRTVLRKYADRARSGNSTVGRDDLERMLESARAREFGVLVVENVDRLARNLSILSAVFKELEGLGIEMHQPERGRLGLTDIAFQGLMGDEGRRLLMERTSYAKFQMARNALVPAGCAYGYATVPGHPGHRTIVEMEAEVVRQMYAMRLDGLRPAQIAACLNNRPHIDRTWTYCGIMGVLANPIYNGHIVYNQKSHRKDAKTGRSKVVMHPRSEWIVTRLEDLRIVDREVWEAVQVATHHAKKKGRVAQQPIPHCGRKYLLSNKVKCHSCGGNMSIRFGRQCRVFKCTSQVTTGICKSRQRVRVDDLERTVIDQVAAHVLDPRCAEAYIDAYNRTRTESRRDHGVARERLNAELGRLSRELDETWEERNTEGYSETYLVNKRRKLSTQYDAVEGKLAAMPDQPRPVGLDERRMTMLREAAAGMTATLPFRPNDENGLRLSAAFRELVERIVVRRTGLSSFEGELHLTIAPLLDGSEHSHIDLPGKLVLPLSHRSKGRAYAVSDQARIDLARLENGDFALRDHEWDAVRHLIPVDYIMGRRRRGTWDPRNTVEAYLYVLISGAPWQSMPSRFGPYHLVRYCALKLIDDGIWRLIAETLTGLDPLRFNPELAEAGRGNALPGRTRQSRGDHSDMDLAA